MFAFLIGATCMAGNLARARRRLMSGLSRNVTAPGAAVTHRYANDKFAGQEMVIVGGMSLTPEIKDETFYP
jgi:hypothetical protein